MLTILLAESGRYIIKVISGVLIKNKGLWPFAILLFLARITHSVTGVQLKLKYVHVNILALAIKY